MNTDPIDLMREQWARERPELDSKGFALVGRLLRLGNHLERRVNQALASHDLSLWAFDVLATLRRQGSPYRLTPTELSQSTLLTPGAMTHRINRLEAAGLVLRETDPDDRRGVWVSLSPSGIDLVDRAIETRFAEAESAVKDLPARDRAQLERILRRLLSTLENG